MARLNCKGLLGVRFEILFRYALISCQTLFWRTPVRGLWFNCSTDWLVAILSCEDPLGTGFEILLRYRLVSGPAELWGSSWNGVRDFILVLTGWWLDWLVIVHLEWVRRFYWGTYCLVARLTCEGPSVKGFEILLSYWLVGGQTELWTSVLIGV